VACGRYGRSGERQAAGLVDQVDQVDPIEVPVDRSALGP
jgi:hypothetical protein